MRNILDAVLYQIVENVLTCGFLLIGVLGRQL